MNAVIATIRLSLGLITSVALSIGCAAHACSVAATYRAPSTLELVEKADAIVLAQVVDGGVHPDDEIAGMGGRLAAFAPSTMLKGDIAVERIAYEDALLELPEHNLDAVASDPRNIVDPHPEVFSGSCVRFLFRPGMLVLLFLERRGADFVPLAPPFSRAFEDVPAPDALWVKAVRMYVSIAAAPSEARPHLMQRERERHSGALDDPDSRSLADELTRALELAER